MKARTACFLLPLVAWACAAPRSSEPLLTSAPLTAKTPKVLFIGLDGVRPDALLAADTPYLDKLAKTGASSYDARTCAMTVSGPSWSSMLTGAWPERHGVVDNDFGGNRIPAHPPIFAHLEEQEEDFWTASVVHWEPIHTWLGKYADQSWARETDEAVTERATEMLAGDDLDLLFLQYDGVDHAGHTYGFDPEKQEYLDAIEEMDKQVGWLFEMLGSRPGFDSEDWLILVSTDHGGSGTGHGENTPEHRTIFVIANGTGFPAGTTMRKVQVVDLMPTAMRHLGVEPIAPVDGTPLQGRTLSS